MKAARSAPPVWFPPASAPDRRAAAWTAWRAGLGGLLLAALLAGAAAAEDPKPKPKPHRPAAGLDPAPSAAPSGEPDGSIYEPADGKARTSLFGTTGEGYKFVYVFDRSSSMGGSGAKSLKAVKAELEKSLAKLDKVHQFQLIFYNEKPLAFNPSGTPGKLAFANPQNRERALKFIAGITADGGTRHDDALRMAIGMRPDVIFFLTDGDDPKLDRRQLDAVNRLASGITINTIEFGSGPKGEEDGFSAVLAKENGGQHAYVNTRELDPGSRPPKSR